MNHIIEQQLSGFFAEADAVCGSEATLHALFSYHLIMCGIDHRTVYREYRLGKSPVDIVMLDKAPEHGGKARLAIEFKGGAYNTRNALFDTVDAMGRCHDLVKLQPFVDAGMICWFICVDMAELGVALNKVAQLRVAEQCRKRGICFAYFCQGESQYLLETGNGPVLQHCAIPTERQTATRFLTVDSNAPWVKRLKALCAKMDCSEDTYIAWLYRALRESGYGVEQLSLETYFNCANGGSRMQIRPDMSVFDPEVCGRFNLYRHGDRRQPNDAHKLAHLQAIVEVKGSAATAKMSAARFAALVEADINKLARWRELLSAAHPRSRARDATYIMLVIDRAKHGRKEVYASHFRNKARDSGVELIYL